MLKNYVLEDDCLPIVCQIEEALRVKTKGF